MKLESVQGKKNPFVEKCLALTLVFVQQHLERESKLFDTSFCASHYLHIELQANNDFYSQIGELQKRNLPLLSTSLAKLPKFLPCPRDSNGNEQKTGLGSSAALTASLIGSILQWFDVIRIGLRPDSDDRRLVHNLAQLAHGIAQGNIGSGFDVAAAVYGTQMYRRFNPAPFEPCKGVEHFGMCDPALLYAAVTCEGVGAAIPSTASVNALLDYNMMSELKARKGTDREVMIQKQIQRMGWSQTIRPFALAPGLDIVLGDVCGGSSSPSMARKVTVWKCENPDESSQLWDDISSLNDEIFAALESLNGQFAREPLEFNANVKWASEHMVEQWNTKTQQSPNATLSTLAQLAALFKRARTFLKVMGDKAGVGIEPESQTALCDATMRLPGVVSCGVPGAGGMDAVFALVLSDEARDRVEKLWSTWTGAANKVDSNGGVAVCPLSLRAGKGIKAGLLAHFNGSE